MNLKGGCQGLSVETMLIRKSLIHSIRIALCDNLEFPGTRKILEKRTLLRGNYDNFYCFFVFLSCYLGAPSRDYAHSKEHNSLYQNRLLRPSGIIWNESNSRRHIIPGPKFKILIFFIFDLYRGHVK